MIFRIELDVSARESFGDYRYYIYDGDRLVARYWHDYRETSTASNLRMDRASLGRLGEWSTSSRVAAQHHWCCRPVL